MRTVDNADVCRDAHFVRAAEARRLPGYLGVIAVGPDGTVLHISPDLDGRFDLTVAEVVGHQFLDFIDRSDTGQAVESFGGVVARPGFHQAVQIGIVGRDGGVEQADVVAENCLDVAELGCILINIGSTSDRARSVQLIDDQAEVVRQVALGATAEETIGAVLGFCERVMPAFRAAAYLRDVYEVGAATVAPSLPASFVERMAVAIREVPTVPGALAQYGAETIVAHDLDEPHWADARRLAPTDIRSVWSVPIGHQHRDRPAGVIEVYGPDPAHPRDEDWVVLRLVSRLAAAGLDRLRLQRVMRDAAEIDPLTGTSNRRVVTETIASVIGRGEVGVPVCFIDLDRLKVVNDSLGHEAGDQLIAEAGQRLAVAVGDGGLVGRFGGDEFVAVGSGELDAAGLAQRCVEVFDDPMFVGGRRWRVTASVGVVTIDEQRTPGEVLRDADAAMYDAKRSGRNRWREFDAATRARVLRRMQLEQQLPGAIDRNEATAHFQPIVSVNDWSVVGVETLARWSLGGEPVGPDEFIPVAEELGLIDRLGSQMIAAALDLLVELSDAGIAVRRVGVNVSPQQLQSSALHDQLLLASGAGAPVELLCLEMTEQHMIDDSADTLRSLERYTELGVALAVDDFGTGFSSLGSLHRLPARNLKIDRSLIHRVGEPTGRSVVEAVVGVARAFGLVTVAEGVETVEQADVVRAIGVDAVQGYLFARPEPRGELIGRLQRAWPWDVARTDLPD